MKNPNVLAALRILNRTLVKAKPRKRSPITYKGVRYKVRGQMLIPIQ
jgi:hypothetical protein